VQTLELPFLKAERQRSTIGIRNLFSNYFMAGVVQLAETAFESAWLPRATKDHYIAELKAYAG